MANAILLQLGWEDDPDGDVLYNHMYLRRQVVRHLLLNWNKLGKQVTLDITRQYGRPVSEINGRLIATEKKVCSPDSFSLSLWCQLGVPETALCLNNNLQQFFYSLSVSQDFSLFLDLTYFSNV